MMVVKFINLKNNVYNVEIIIGYYNIQSIKQFVYQKMIIKNVRKYRL